jgi:NAD(P)-dependent dehydrogenase (short-subunit alcohol dehydrogenase family)
LQWNQSPRFDAEQPLQDVVTLITGGGRGIGRMLAQAYGAAGARVGVLARSANELCETVALVEAAGGIAAAARADVTNTTSVARAMRKLRHTLGPPDVLVNNAGIVGPIGPLWETATDDWWKTMEVNLRGTIICTQLALPEMIGRRRGRIINMSSQAGAFRWPLVSAYSVSKASLVKLTDNLARETRRYGVSVFSVHPGLLPIGMATSDVMVDVAPASHAGRVRAWVEAEFREGRGADPAAAAALLLRVASGELDPLSGQHLSVHDDIEAMLEQATAV